MDGALAFEVSGMGLNPVKPKTLTLSPLGFKYVKWKRETELVMIDGVILQFNFRSKIRSYTMYGRN